MTEKLFKSNIYTAPLSIVCVCGYHVTKWVPSSKKYIRLLLENVAEICLFYCIYYC